MKPSIKNAASKSKLHQSLLIHYVSLIPSLVDCTNISIDANVADTWFKTTIWMDCVQFYTFRLGFEVEHAILLCCFLLHLDRNVGLVIGSGLLDGPTAYVILYSSDDSEESPLGDQSQPIIIDAKRGQQFSVSDFNVTLNSVDCIITTDNVLNKQCQLGHANFMFIDLRKHTEKFTSESNEFQLSKVKFVASPVYQKRVGPSEKYTSRKLFSVQFDSGKLWAKVK